MLVRLAAIALILALTSAHAVDTDRLATGGQRGPGDNLIALSPGVAQAPQGLAFTLTVRLDFPFDPTRGGGIDISWNPEQVTLEAWQPMPLGAVFNPGEPLPDRILDIFFDEPNGVSGSVELGQLIFRALVPGPAQIDVTPNFFTGNFISAETGEPQNVEFQGANIEVGPALNPNDAETLWRHIAVINPDADCPVDPITGCALTESWDTQELFEPSPGGSMPPALDSYCVYEIGTPPSGAQLAELDALFNMNCFNAMAPDVFAVTYMGQPQIEPLLWPALRDDFRAQAGKPDAPIAAAATGIRLAIVDTQPGGVSAPGNSQHGFTLRSMADDLLCTGAGGNCGVDIVTNLGLPMLRCNTDPRGVCRDDSAGGYMATTSQLAAAIRAAVVQWLDSAPADRLVINLSVGWHPRFGAGPGDGPEIEAVFLALEDAVCRGAVVIASAGNPINEPTVFPPADPLMPGGWESFAAPDELDCTAALEVPPDSADFPVTPGEYRPLVHAAGAVGADSLVVAGRLLGEPRLVAFGDHAVTVADVGGGPTQVQTGTSVSALVVSAATAAAWAQAPAVASFEIMSSVYDSGLDLSRTADFADYSCAGCDTAVHRVGVCAAAAFACSEHTGGPCPVSCAEPALPGPRPLPVDDLQTQFVPTATVDISELDQISFPDPMTCGDYQLRYRDDDSPVYPCPQFQFWGIQAVPFASGQPSSQPCEVCAGLRSHQTLYMDISPTFSGELSDVTLTCGTAEAFRLPVPTGFGPGDSFLVTGVPSPCTGARLAYAVTESPGATPAVSVSSPVIVDFPDADRDTVEDSSDNCLDVANPDQRDADGDALGSLCDADLNNNCVVNFSDLGLMRQVFFCTDASDACVEADLDGDGAVNFEDLGIMRSQFFQPPGPSGVAGNLCDTSA